MRAGESDADSYTVHLKASVIQLFQHNFGFQVTILMMKMVEVQKVYFAPPKETEHIYVKIGPTKDL